MSLANQDASTPASVTATHASLLSFTASARYQMQGLAEHVCPYELEHQGSLIRPSEGKLWCTEIMEDSGNGNLDGAGKSSNEDLVLPGLLGGMTLPVFDEMPPNSGEEEIALFSEGFDYPVFDDMPLEKVIWDEEVGHDDLLGQLAQGTKYLVVAEMKPTAHPTIVGKLHTDVVYDLIDEMSCEEDVAENSEHVIFMNAVRWNSDVQDLSNEIPDESLSSGSEHEEVPWVTSSDQPQRGHHLGTTSDRHPYRSCYKYDTSRPDSCFKIPKVQPDGLVAGSLDLLTTVLKNAPGAVVKAVFDTCYVSTIRIALESDDH